MRTYSPSNESFRLPEPQALQYASAMLDLQFIRDNPDIVRAAMKNKNRDGAVDLDRLLSLAEERKQAAGQISEINRRRNEAAAARDAVRGKALKDDLQALEERYAALEKELVSLLIKLPNIPSPDTPIGADESQNTVLREWGERPAFSFTPKNHGDHGRLHGLIDYEKAAEVSGARVSYLLGDLALLQFALINLALTVLTSRETLKEIADRAGLAIDPKPFIPAIVPVFMHSQVMNRMARLDPIEDRYYFERDDLVLIGSAEHTLGPLHMDETLSEDMLPVRYVGYSTAFRREAGAAGKDTRGILRQHQFDKVEMESFTLPEDGMREQDFMVALQEHLMRELGIPYRVISVCTGDMGFPDQRQVDIEAWMPGQEGEGGVLGRYRETHSADYTGGFQARRLKTRVRRADGTLEPVHMNDATVFAIGRTLIAIMENCQQEDGSILIPKVLQPRMGKEKIQKR